MADYGAYAHLVQDEDCVCTCNRINKKQIMSCGGVTVEQVTALTTAGLYGHCRAMISALIRDVVLCPVHAIRVRDVEGAVLAGDRDPSAVALRLGAPPEVAACAQCAPKIEAIVKSKLAEQARARRAPQGPGGR
eukprot:m51a1_g2421 hypothetical protein (134) ;mRNA; r:809428-809829